ncbi:MAG: ParB family protein [Halioglobus sp.]
MKTEVSNRASFMPPEQGAARDNTRPMRLEVTQVRSYDGNPRRCPNSEYERIKASIRAQGLDQPLVVTSRPDETGYLLLAGGNTRLRAMLALYQETGDEAYRYLECFFKPWIAESDVLLSHLRENELRDNLCFIDKARAVFEAKALLEDEIQGQPLSQRRLSELITARGLSFSQTLISRMAYAVLTLWPLIPQALSAGMGTPQVARIQRLERSVRDIWNKKSLGAEEEFEDTFAALCRRYDGPDWSTDVLRGALETEISAIAEVDLAMVRLELEALIKGRPFPEITLEVVRSASTSPLEQTAVEPEDSGDVIVGKVSAPSGLLKPAPRIQAAHLSSRGRVEKGGAKGVAKESKTLDQLRQQACQLALELAHAHGLGNLIEPLPGQGLGFMVEDVPNAALTSVLDEDLAQLVLAVWWQLAACAEVFAAPAAQIEALLKEGSSLRAFLVDQDRNQLFKAVPPSDLGLMGVQLWRWLSDEDWKTLAALTQTYRELHRMSREAVQPLWDV